MTNLGLLEKLCLDKNVGLSVIHDVVHGEYRCELRITNGDLDMRETIVSGYRDVNIAERLAYKVFREMFSALLTDKKEAAIKIRQSING